MKSTGKVTRIAADCGCQYRGQPSWRRLIDHIASGRLTVVNRPDKNIRAFQEETRRPIRKQREAQSLARFIAQMERNKLRQREKRRAAGHPSLPAYLESLARETDPSI